jgi:hypothetical protein
VVSRAWAWSFLLDWNRSISAVLHQNSWLHWEFHHRAGFWDIRAERDPSLGPSQMEEASVRKTSRADWTRLGELAPYQPMTWVTSCFISRSSMTLFYAAFIFSSSVHSLMSWLCSMLMN